jgi:hypothetical protein
VYGRGTKELSGIETHDELDGMGGAASDASAFNGNAFMVIQIVNLISPMSLSSRQKLCGVSESGAWNNAMKVMFGFGSARVVSRPDEKKYIGCLVLTFGGLSLTPGLESFSNG